MLFRFERTSDKYRYPKAIKALRRLRDDYQRAGDEEGFTTYLDELRQRQRRKTSFIAKLDAAFAPAADLAGYVARSFRVRRGDSAFPAGQGKAAANRISHRPFPPRTAEMATALARPTGSPGPSGSPTQTRQRCSRKCSAGRAPSILLHSKRKGRQ